MEDYYEPETGWPGDGSGLDDLADLNQNEADDYRDDYRRISKVRCDKCRQEFDSEKVKFLNIESDIMGRDVMTFECPICKEQRQSFIFL